MTNYPNLKDFVHPESKKWVAFLDHLFEKIDDNIERGGRILILTLTKKSSEEVTNYLVSRGYKTYYLHSEIETTDRREIIKKLRKWDIDILVGVNLLREWIDLPEVSLVAILDADKEGFLRSTTALIQTIGRAARNPDGEVILYGDVFTESMTRAMWETHRRRRIQDAFNLEHGITPEKATSNIKDLETVKTDEDLQQNQFQKIQDRKNKKKLKRVTKKERDMILKDLRQQLDEAVKTRDFEQAVVLRDQIKEISGEEG